MKSILLGSCAAVLLGTTIAGADPQSVISAAEFQCVPGNIAAGAPIIFTSTGISSGHSVAGTSTGQFTSFVLQPGIYRVDWSFGMYQSNVIGWSTLIPLPTGGGTAASYQPAINGVFSLPWSLNIQVVTGANTAPAVNTGFQGGLMAVSSPNTVLQFVAAWNGPSGFAGNCELILTQLQ